MSSPRSSPYIDQTIRLPKEALRPGTLLHQRYVVVDKLATTALNLVYRAYDLDHDQWVVVKMQVADPSASGLSQAEADHCFTTEVDLLSRLQHVQLPRLHAAYEDAFGRWMVMDYIPGRTLAKLLEDEQPALDERLDLFNQICAVVAYLHRQRPPILHTDIKATNVIVTPAGHLVLIDLGTAGPPGRRTWTNKSIGTPGYAPPEQVQHRSLDERSDVYALAKVSAELLGPVADEPIVRIVLARATAAQPDVRHSSAVQFRQSIRRAVALMQWQYAPPWASAQLRPHVKWLALVSIILIGLLLFTLWVIPEPQTHKIGQTSTPLLGRIVTPTPDMSTAFASPIPSPTAVPLRRISYVVAHTGGIGLNLRADPMTSSIVLEGLPDGTRLEQIGSGVDVNAAGQAWQNVRAPSGNEGWVAVQYLQPVP